MPDDRVLQRDAVSAEDAAALAGDRQCLTCVVQLAQADLLRSYEVLVLQSPEVQGQQHALAQFERHVGELLLGELERGDRLVELLAVDAVVDGRLEAVSGSTEGAEDDAEACLVEARQRAT